MKYTVSNLINKSWQDKNFTEFDLKDEQGVFTNKVSDWTGTVKEDGQVVEGEVTKNDKGYYKFTPPKAESGRKPNMDRIMEKKANLITEAQANKDKRIHEAQDRSAWMWAKNNASTLIAAQKPEAMGIRSLDEIANMVIELATKIYNGEPYEPFS